MVSQGRPHAKYQAGHLEEEGPATHKALEPGSELTASFQRNDAAASWPGSLACVSPSRTPVTEMLSSLGAQHAGLGDSSCIRGEGLAPHYP